MFLAVTIKWLLACFAVHLLSSTAQTINHIPDSTRTVLYMPSVYELRYLRCGTQPQGETGTPYSNLLDCFTQIAKTKSIMQGSCGSSIGRLQNFRLHTTNLVIFPFHCCFITYHHLLTAECMISLKVKGVQFQISWIHLSNSLGN